MRICQHDNDSHMGYVEWHVDAEKRMEKGEKQKQCPSCNLWIWEHLWRKE